VIDWIDVSVAIRDGMVHWPTDAPIEVVRTAEIKQGAICNVTKISMGVHSGTHVDAPVHFKLRGKGVDELPLDAFVGPARVIAIEHPNFVAVDELARAKVKPDERILLKTRNSPRAWKQSPRFVEDAVYLTAEAARWLATRKVKTIAIDYLSLAGYRANNAIEVHRALIDAGVAIIEGVDLSRVPPGPCDLICLPIKIAGSDGAPARVVIHPRHRRTR
jgi:arylformamidase